MKETETGRQPVGHEQEAPTARAMEVGGAKARGVRTPLGTMVIVLIYAVATVVLWAYVYYQMLRYGGGFGGH